MISASKMDIAPKISGSFFFDPSDAVYKDHFPGNPVVPGSLIIYAFIEILKNNKAIKKSYTIRNFRFKSFIAPGEFHYDIHYESSTFKCRLFKNETAAVTGEVVI